MAKIFDIESYKEKRFEVLAKTKNSAEIAIYGNVGSQYDGITAKGFNDLLNSLGPEVKELSIRINSPGGSVFEGITIYERLKQFKAKKKVYVDGLAASIASVIALAGDEIFIGEGAMMMIHRPWTIAMGNSSEFERTINLLDKIEDSMIAIYSRKTGLSRTELSKMMEEDYWMTSQQAIDLGFANTLVEASASLHVAAKLLGKAEWLKFKPSISASAELKVKITNLKNQIKSFHLAL